MSNGTGSTEMKSLFCSEGEAALAAVMAKRPLLAFDFDGTLAPIVARPDDARVSVAIARRLERLARQLPVAIVTGRAVEDVQRRLSFEPHFIIGNHGIEDAASTSSSDMAAALDTIRAHISTHGDELAAAGVEVEDKRYSIALHYRLARDRRLAHELIMRLVGEAVSAVDVFGGKCVVNVVAAGAPDKALALARLVERCGVQSAVFVGDDVNDEPVFARAPADWLTVKVGRDDPASRAKFYLDSIGEVAAMLDRMLMLSRADSPLH